MLRSAAAPALPHRDLHKRGTSRARACTRAAQGWRRDWTSADYTLTARKQPRLAFYTSVAGTRRRCGLAAITWKWRAGNVVCAPLQAGEQRAAGVVWHGSVSSASLACGMAAERHVTRGDSGLRR